MVWKMFLIKKKNNNKHNSFVPKDIKKLFRKKKSLTKKIINNKSPQAMLRHKNTIQIIEAKIA